MKKFIFLVFPTYLLALISGNPDTPSILVEGFFISDESSFNVRVGAEGNWLMEKKLKLAPESPSGLFKRAKIDGTQVMGTLVINYKERLDAYGSVGSRKVAVEMQNTNRTIAQSRNGLSWNAGATLTILEVQDTALGVDVKYERSVMDVAYFQVNGATVSADPSCITLKGWQISVGLTQQIGLFFPYAGLTFTDLEFDVSPILRDSFGKLEFKQRDLVGILLGCTLSNETKASFTLEARLLNERAISLLGTIRF